MKFNKVYFQKDAIERGEDFDVWYEDGAQFLHFEGPWQSEKDKIAVMGRMGGEVGHIKCDHLALCYYLRVERYQHCLHTYTIFKHYYIEGMLWDIQGSFAFPPFDFVKETKRGDEFDRQKMGHVKLVNFKNKGECYEVRVKDVAHLRVATLAVIGMGLKEKYRGKSEGEENPNPTKLQKLKDAVFTNKGKTFEQVCAEDEDVREIAERFDAQKVAEVSAE